MKNIREQSLKELEDFMVKNDEKKFRARQIFEWIWTKNVDSFDDMTNLSLQTREMLKEYFIISSLKIHDIRTSLDKTKKIAFCLSDNEIVEGVLIPSGKRSTACISSQVGCPLGCLFCATGKMKYKRNLSSPEIIDQVIEINKQNLELYNRKLSNIVLMGMGEPLLNYDNVIKAIQVIASPEYLGFSPQRITLSTAGLTKEIKRLGDDHVKFLLAVSLHTANNDKRNKLMPINKSNPLPELIKAIKHYYNKTEERVTFEYLLLKGFNDSINDAKELAEFCKNFPCKINIIDYNQINGSGFERSSEENKENFVNFLTGRNMIVNIRQSRGQDIEAACGQLANKIIDKN